MKAILNDLNENDNFKFMKPITLGYNILHGGDLNENDNFRAGKLIIHGYIILHGGDLNGQEHFKRRHYSCDLLGSKD